MPDISEEDGERRRLKRGRGTGSSFIGEEVRVLDLFLMGEDVQGLRRESEGEVIALMMMVVGVTRILE